MPSTDKELSTQEQRLLSGYNSLSPENQKLIDTMIDTMLDNQDREFRVQCERGFERIFHNDNCSAAGIGYALSDQVRGEYVYIRTSRNACLHAGSGSIWRTAVPCISIITANSRWGVYR